MITLVAAVARNGCIGKDGTLPWRIPEDMQRKHGFAPLGDATGRVKQMIFGENSARLYKYDGRAELSTDHVTVAKAAYEREGSQRTNLRYGYVTPPDRLA